MIDFFKDHTVLVLAALIVAYVLYRRVTRTHRERQAAARILSNLEKECTKPRAYRAVAAGEQPTGRTAAYYARKQAELEELGFSFLADMVDDNLDTSLFRPLVQRLLAKRDGTVVADVYFLQRKGLSWLWGALGAPVTIRVTELTTEFSDGTWIGTATGPRTLGAMELGAWLRGEYLGQDCDSEQLLNRHIEKAARYQEEHPGVEIISLATLEDVFASIARQQAQKMAAIKARGYLINHREYERMSGGALSGANARIFQHLEEMQAQRGYAGWREAEAQTVPAEAEAAPLAPDDVVTALDDEDGLTTPADPAAEGRRAELLDVQDEMRGIINAKSNWWHNLALLVISIVVFFNLGWFSWGIMDTAIIILVLAVHEAGHYVGMRLFGYSNVKMFFIPLAGAAVSGISYRVPTYKRCLTYMMGPLPGIVLSLVLLIAKQRWDIAIDDKVIFMFLFINAFNLLPFMPLDGGRLVNDLVYSRHRVTELLFRVGNAVVFLLIAYGLNSLIFLILALLNLLTIGTEFRKSRIAALYRRERKAAARQEAASAEQEANSEAVVPEPALARLLALIRAHIPGLSGAKIKAQTALDVWERVNTPPPRIPATVLLTTVYLLGWLAALLTLGGYIVTREPQREIVAFEDENGLTRHKQVTSLAGMMREEVELNEEMDLYHGRARYYRPEYTLSGQWRQGRRVGRWEYHCRKSEELYRVVEYDDTGMVVCYESLINDEWVVTPFEEMPEELQTLFSERANAPPEGPK